MKKLLCLLLALALCCAGVACAEDWTTVNQKEKRGIKIKEAGVNTVEAGVSPITGLRFADYEIPDGWGGQAVTGRYMPMLVQIDNAEGGLDKVAPWGVNEADIVYELPLYANGPTRLTYLFSDVMPSEVGPVRSARVGHARLRQEWNGGMIHVGTQSMDGSNAGREFGNTGGYMGKTRFDGNASKDKPWMKFIIWDKTKSTSHNVNVNVGEICNLVPADTVPTEHTYRFTDETPAGVPATEVEVSWKNDTFDSYLRYDEASGKYLRFLGHADGDQQPYVDRETGVQAGFNNVIIQYTSTWYNQGDGAAPVTELVGEGNADFFQGGVYRAGYWKRANGSSRTVYYDADGNEIDMLRGNKFIVCLSTRGFVRYK